MKKVTVEICAVEWCGYSEYYEVEVENIDHAEDAALELHLESFLNSFGLVLAEDGEYVELGEEDEGSTSVIARIIL